jgi:hypothetical protein
MAPLTVARVRALLQSREVELRLFGLTQGRHLDPALLEEQLMVLATRPDRATRAALAPLIASAPEPWARPFVDACLEGNTPEAQKLALVVMLMWRDAVSSERLAPVLGASDPALAALGQVVTAGAAAWPGIQPLLRTPEVATDLIDAIVVARRSDLMALLLAALESAAPEQQRQALAMLGAAGVPPAAPEVAQELMQRRSATVRAEALAWFSHTSGRVSAVRHLIAALDDQDRRVRRRAVELLCAHGDRATALLRRRLRDATGASPEAVRSLAQIASPHARRLLGTYLHRLHQDAVRTMRLLGWIGAAPEARWATLELCLRDHRLRLIEATLAALSPRLEESLAHRVRAALTGIDQRRRASAFELIAAGSAARAAPGAVALLRYLLFEDSVGLPTDDGLAPEEALEEAEASMSQWVRRAARLTGREAARSAGEAREPGVVTHPPGGDPKMALDDQAFERVVALKRTPLFRNVPFETMIEVTHALRGRIYLAGEQVIASGTGPSDLLILESGALALGPSENARTLVAPACFGEIVAGEATPWPRIVALQDSRVSFLRSSVFEELCLEHPEIAIELCRLLARRLREVGGASADLAAPVVGA